MKLTDNTWGIFNIAATNHVDIGVGKDMFIANLEQRKAVYRGADELDYAVLGAEWAKLSLAEKSAQRELYGKITAVTEAGGRYRDLTAARREEDRERFEAVVAEAVAALEASGEPEAE